MIITFFNFIYYNFITTIFFLGKFDTISN